MTVEFVNELESILAIEQVEPILRIADFHGLENRIPGVGLNDFNKGVGPHLPIEKLISKLVLGVIFFQVKAKLIELIRPLADVSDAVF